mmetsp:Transcript_105477/g.264123  ORF Transcript_105477/g.264123 Transcript_105477/m.264123 type:complete len:202 (-) Transcript_105477:16-621(-)
MLSMRFFAAFTAAAALSPLAFALEAFTSIAFLILAAFCLPRDADFLRATARSSSISCSARFVASLLAFAFFASASFSAVSLSSTRCCFCTARTAARASCAGLAPPPPPSALPSAASPSASPCSWSSSPATEASAEAGLFFNAGSPPAAAGLFNTCSDGSSSTSASFSCSSNSGTFVIVAAAGLFRGAIAQPARGRLTEPLR